jgi:hypothetical protein
MSVTELTQDVQFTVEMQRSQEYAQAVAAIMSAMPPERAEQVYDFARFLQARRAGAAPIAKDTDEWLSDSEEQMQAEDAMWEAAYARHKDKFLTLREAARAEIEAGATEEMYDANGDLAQ